jgi:hypothetical protein
MQGTPSNLASWCAKLRFEGIQILTENKKLLKSVTLPEELSTKYTVENVCVMTVTLKTKILPSMEITIEENGEVKSETGRKVQLKFPFSPPLSEGSTVSYEIVNGRCTIEPIQLDSVSNNASLTKGNHFVEIMDVSGDVPQVPTWPLILLILN